MAELLFFFETDCPTCRLAVPYLNRLAAAWDGKGTVQGLSQDPELPTSAFVASTRAQFPVAVDESWRRTKQYDPSFVPSFYLLGDTGEILNQFFGFSKADFNGLAGMLGLPPIADRRERLGS